MVERVTSPEGRTFDWSVIAARRACGSRCRTCFTVSSYVNGRSVSARYSVGAGIRGAFVIGGSGSYPWQLEAAQCDPRTDGAQGPRRRRRCCGTRRARTQRWRRARWFGRCRRRAGADEEGEGHSRRADSRRTPAHPILASPLAISGVTAARRGARTRRRRSSIGKGGSVPVDTVRSIYLPSRFPVAADSV